MTNVVPKVAVGWRKPNLPALANTVLGRQLYGPWVFTVAFVFSLLIRLVGLPGLEPLGLGENILLSLGVTVAGYLWLQLITRNLKRIPRVGWVLAIVSVFGVGAIRGLILQWYFTRTLGTDGSLLATRVVSSSIIIGVAILLTSYTHAVVRNRLRALRRLRELRWQLSHSLENNQAQIDRWHKTLQVSVQAKLLAQLRKHLSKDGLVMADHLKDVVGEVVRPLSRELMFDVPNAVDAQLERSRDRGSLGKVYRQAFALEWRAAPGIVTLLTGMAGFPIFSALAAEGRRVFFLVPLAIIYLGYMAANFVYARLQKSRPSWQRILLFALLMTGAAVPGSYVSLILLDYASGLRGQLNALLLGLATMVIAAVVATARAVAQASAEDQRQLELATQELRWLVARTSSIMWERQRELSQLLHGPVQTALSAAAIRLDLAKDDPKQLQQVARESRTSILDAVNALTKPQEVAIVLSRGLESVVNGWQGICQVDLDLPQALEQRLNQDSAAARLTLDIVQEAVGNAIRHGGAKQVRVVIDANIDGQLHILVSNDGTPPTSAAQPGLGTKLLNDCTIWWTRTVGTDGPVLECSLPFTAA